MPKHFQINIYRVIKGVREIMKSAQKSKTGRVITLSGGVELTVNANGTLSRNLDTTARKSKEDSRRLKDFLEKKKKS